MQAKSVMYAAVGAPVVAARKVGDGVSTLKGRLDKGTAGYTKKAEARINAWAAEGEKLINKISEGKVVEEISSKVDLDQAREQVTKLRDQLEDMLTTWRSSFRPEGDAKTEAAPAAAKKPATKPAAKKPATKPAAKTSAAKTTKSSTAAKTSSAKTSSASAAKAS